MTPAAYRSLRAVGTSAHAERTRGTTSVRWLNLDAVLAVLGELVGTAGPDLSVREGVHGGRAGRYPNQPTAGATTSVTGDMRPAEARTRGLGGPRG